MSRENLLLALVSSLFTLLMLEVGLRVVAPDLAGEPVTSNQYLFYEYDPKLGWANKPGVKGTFARQEFSYDLAINAHGLRGREVSLDKPAGMRRVAVLGDSFTWGIGASDAELYTTLLEKDLGQAEVLNFGISGYGPVQYHLLTDKVLRFQPDAVVVAFCLGNDFIDSVLWERYRYYKPFARLDEAGKLVIDGYPIPNVKRFPSSYDGGLLGALHQASYLFRFVDRHALGLVGRLENFGQKGLKLSGRQYEFYATPDDPEVKAALAVNRALFAAMADAYRAKGIRLIVMAVPTGCEFGVCFPDLTTDTMVTLRLLKASLAGLDLTLVDPTPVLTKADYWEHDGHWRPVGHRKVSDQLLPVVKAALAGP
ncbi:MAG: SGNH/GDSL hydrolase family protein [Hyphomicrobiaceae bacterium]|nr:SGNH/GDSL hydrolase family protein [Hyphomicrobiaceae bacterium]